SVATKHERVAVVPTGRDDSGHAETESAFAQPGSSAFAEATADKPLPATADRSKRRVQSITVPVMGEGIRNAKIVSLLKKPGDPVALDDELSEVETDKAVNPIQSSFGGVSGARTTRVRKTVDIGD